MSEEDYETWLLDAGDVILQQKADGLELTVLDRLIERFWFLDYCMRNAGDLANLEDDPCGVEGFLALAREDAESLGLPAMSTLLALKRDDFENKFFERFERVCRELRKVYEPRD